MSTPRFVRYAPKTAKFLVTTLTAGLSGARRLLLSAPLSGADGGDGGDFTVSIEGATSSARGVVKLAGQLGGTADNPDVRGLRALDGGTPQLLALGEVADGQLLARSGTSIAGASALLVGGGTMGGDIAMGGHRVTGLASGASAGDAATYGQLTSMLNGLDWQNSVLDALSTPPASPSVGDRYIVLATATGAWAGHEAKIAQKSATGWDLVVPNKGFTVHNDATGQDLTYTGDYPSGIWVNIGASVDHGSLLNLGTGNPHPQYQLAADREQPNGYAGLGADTLPVRPTRGVRAGGDPSTPAPGEVWIVGTELKYRNDAGSPVTEFAERQSRRNQNDGYAGLDNTGRVGAQQAPAKAVYATGGSQALAASDVGAPPSGRAVSAGVGLAGGGDLTQDRALAIAAFGGLVARDFDPAQANWAANETKIHVTYDIGSDGHLAPTALRLPAAVDAALVTEVVFEFHDATTKTITNSNIALTLDDTMQGLADALMGGASGPDQNNGRAVRKVTFQTRNTTGNAVNNIDVGLFRIRAYAFPRGGGSPL